MTGSGRSREQGTSIGGIDRLVALSIAAGDGFDDARRAAEPTLYEMGRPMTDAVRAAGEEDASLAYTQTMGRDDPQEGFIDEASETMVLFPFPADAVARMRAEAAARGTTWRGGLAMILTAAGGAMLFRHMFDLRDSAIGLALLAAAALLFRDDWRRKRRATGK
ncbi:MAG: hypothetical protein ABW173_03920 [Sphingomonas sp.]